MTTYIIVPYAEHGKIEDVRAAIAVQVSTNDRARLVSSELHRGVKRYICSLNGCKASSKTTNDIGDDLIAKFAKEEIYYVVIEEEKQNALIRAKEKVSNAKKDTDITKTKKRENWLKNYCINYNEFIDECLRLSIS